MRVAQLDLFATEVKQEPLHPWITLVTNDDHIDVGYKALDRAFEDNMVVLDIETYGCTDPSPATLKKAPKKKAIEQNKYGLSAYFGDIRLIQLSGLSQDDVLVVDFKTIWDRQNLSPKYLKFLEAVKDKAIAFAKRKGRFIGQNIGFDLLFLRQHWGLKVWSAYDTMILSQLLYAGILTYRHSLKEIVKRELNISVDKTEQSSDFSLDLRNAQINYAAYDIIYTKKAFLALIEKIKLEGLGMVAKIESEFTPALVEINHWGLPVDLEELEKQIKYYYQRLLDIDIEFNKLYPFSNIRSSKKIAQIVAGLPKVVKKSDDSELDDDSDDELEEELILNDDQIGELAIATAGSSKADLALLSDHKVVQLVSDYRTLNIYLKYCLQVKQELIQVNGIWRVSGNIRQLTRKGQGRTSSGGKNNPIKCQGVNLQNPPNSGNMPKRLKDQGCPIVRDIFKPPTGQVNINIDLPAAHLAIATFLSGEKAMEEAKNQGLDLHAITMQSVFAVVDDYAEYRHLSVKEITDINNDESHPWHKIFKPIRKMCKNVVYGGLNNQSPPTLQNTIKTNEKKHVAIEVCEAMVNAFPSVFPKIAMLRDSLWNQANNCKSRFDGHWYGKFQTDFGFFKTPGYKRIVYSFCKFNLSGKPYVKKGDIANVWLGTEADIMKSSIARVYQECVFNDLYDFCMGLICHDELVGRVPEHQALPVAQIVKDSFLWGMRRFTGEGKVPLPEMEKPASKLISKGWHH